MPRPHSPSTPISEGLPEHLRALGGLLRERAAEIRDEAGSAVRRAERTAWTGAAARTLLASAHGLAGDLRRSADDHDDAADDLEAHARAVAAAIEHIVERRDRLLRLAAGVGARLREAGGAVVDVAGEVGARAARTALDAAEGADAAAHELRRRLESLELPSGLDPAWLELDLPHAA